MLNFQGSLTYVQAFITKEKEKIFQNGKWDIQVAITKNILKLHLLRSYITSKSLTQEKCVFSDNKVTTAFTNRIKFFGSEQFCLNINKNLSMNVKTCAVLKSLIRILPETTIKAVRPQSREYWNLAKVWRIERWSQQTV